MSNREKTKENMIVKVTSVNQNVGWGAKDPKTGKVKVKYDGCVDKFAPSLSKVSGLLRTGLTKEEEKQFEERLQLPEGHLASNGAYWNNFYIIIPENGLILNDENPMHALYIKVLKADPHIALNSEELVTKQGAEYLMTSEEAVAKEKNTKRDSKVKAFAHFAKMSSVDIVDTLYLMGKVADDTDPEIAMNTLGELIETKPESFLKIVNDELFSEKVFLLKCIKAGVVKKQTASKGFDQPLWYDDISLGKGLDEAVAFIKLPENQNVYIALKKTLQPSKK